MIVDRWVHLIFYATLGKFCYWSLEEGRIGVRPIIIKQTQNYIPAFKILFENIQYYSHNQIRQLGSGLFTSTLLTQKYADRPELLLERFRQIFSILESWKGRNLFNTYFSSSR